MKKEAITKSRLPDQSKALAVVGFAILATACDALRSGDRTWTEEVALDDGSVIIIDRHVEQQMSNALGGGAFNATETKATLSFRKDLATLPPWDLPLMPLLLYRDSSEWVIVATTTTCEVWRNRGAPKAFYWEFRLRGTEWVEVDVSESSFERKTNLLFEYSQPLPSKHINLTTKAQLHSGDQAEMYRVIQRSVRLCQAPAP